MEDGFFLFVELEAELGGDALHGVGEDLLVGGVGWLGVGSGFGLLFGVGVGVEDFFVAEGDVVFGEERGGEEGAEGLEDAGFPVDEGAVAVEA